MLRTSSETDDPAQTGKHSRRNGARLAAITIAGLLAVLLVVALIPLIRPVRFTFGGRTYLVDGGRPFAPDMPQGLRRFGFGYSGGEVWGYSLRVGGVMYRLRVISDH